jgi:hypothetical protein
MGAVSPDRSTVLTWPKTRPLTTIGGSEWTATLEPGRLVLWMDEDHAAVFADPDELRAFAMQCHAAAVEHDLARQIPSGQGRAHLKRQRRRHAEQQARRRLAGEPLHLFRDLR